MTDVTPALAAEMERQDGISRVLAEHASRLASANRLLAEGLADIERVYNVRLARDTSPGPHRAHPMAGTVRNWQGAAPSSPLLKGPDYPLRAICSSCNHSIAIRDALGSWTHTADLAPAMRTFLTVLLAGDWMGYNDSTVLRLARENGWHPDLIRKLLGEMAAEGSVRSIRGRWHLGEQDGRQDKSASGQESP